MNPIHSDSKPDNISTGFDGSKIKKPKFEKLFSYKKLTHSISSANFLCPGGLSQGAVLVSYGLL